jgi:hypothetical protein
VARLAVVPDSVRAPAVQVIARGTGVPLSCCRDSRRARFTTFTAFRRTPGRFAICRPALPATVTHPLVGVTPMPQDGRKLVHAINLSRQSQTGYLAPIPTRNMRVVLLGDSIGAHRTPFRSVAQRGAECL